MTKHEILKNYVLGLTKGFKDYNSLVCLSRGGLGKTETTIKTLKEAGLRKNEHYLYVANYITPKALVNLLRRVNMLQEPKILILDDCEDTLKNQQAIGVLKSALWENDGERKVSWITTRERIEFNFTGRIIFLLNHLVNNSIINAFSDRGLSFEFDFTKEEIVELMRQRIKKDWLDIPYNKKKKIIELLKVADSLSLRDLPKSINLFKLSPHHYQNLILKK